jgi:DegV family protein with EDD domain
MAVRIVTDSACDLSDEELARHGIEVVPLTIRFGAEEYVDRTELSTHQFYEKLASSAEVPQTAAPAPGAFATAFRKLRDEGATEVVCINLSSALSATMQAAQNGAAAVADEIPVRVVDSKSITGGLGTIVVRAAEAAATGATADEVVAIAADLTARQRIYGTLDTLENLKKGGRIGGAQALVGSMLSIKPLVDLSTGAVEEAGRTRTRKKAFAWLRDEVVKAGKIENLRVIHGEAPDIDDFLTLLRESVDMSGVQLSTIGAVIGAHGGPRVVGVAFHTVSTSE